MCGAWGSTDIANPGKSKNVRIEERYDAKSSRAADLEFRPAESTESGKLREFIRGFVVAVDGLGGHAGFEERTL
jgi:hypothetical protein